MYWKVSNMFACCIDNLWKAHVSWSYHVLSDLRQTFLMRYQFCNCVHTSCEQHTISNADCVSLWPLFLWCSNTMCWCSSTSDTEYDTTSCLIAVTRCLTIMALIDWSWRTHTQQCQTTSPALHFTVAGWCIMLSVTTYTSRNEVSQRTLPWSRLCQTAIRNCNMSTSGM